MTRFERYTLIASIILGLLSLQLSWAYGSLIDKFADIILSFITGAISTILLLYIQRSEESKKLGKFFSEYSTSYVRIRQGESGIDILGIRNKITLTHIKNSSSFNGKAEYADGDAEVYLEFEKSNLLIGTGIFQYITNIDHKGTYKIQRDLKDENLLHLYYENTLPDNKVKGYEVWKKIQ